MPLAVKERGEESAFPHLTEEHADLVKSLKVNREERGRDDKWTEAALEAEAASATKGKSR